MGFLLLTGFSIFSSFFMPVLALLLPTAGLGLFIARPFTRGHRHSALLSITLALPLGTITLSILFLGFVALARVLPPALIVGAWIIAVGGFGLLVIWIISHGRELIRQVHWLPLAGGVAAFLLLLVLRLAFLRGLLAPPYADSAYHYLLSSRLLDPSTPLGAVNTGSYYHLGFHTLSSWLAALTGFDLLTILPLTGQVMLTLIPLSVYAFALSLAGERNSARISALAAALLWSMPALAANWGKYPAIAGIALFPAVGTLLLLLVSQKEKKAFLFISTIVLFIGVTGFHTRILFLLFFAGVSAAVIALLRKHADRVVRIIAGFVWITCALLYISTPFIPLVYNGNLFIPIIGGFLLLICALILQPRVTLGIGLFTVLTMVSIYLPLPAWLHLPAASLLDEQFLEMSLFLPFSLVIGIGGAGLIHWVQNKWFKAILWLIFIIWIFFSATNPKVYKPDSCCNFVTPADIAALDWMKAHLPPGSTIYIAGIEKEDGLIGSDAGVWVTPLTAFSTRMLPYDYAWFTAHEYAAICSPTPAYLYVGSQPYSFQINAITHPDWYELVFEYPNSSVYRIIPCQP